MISTVLTMTSIVSEFREWQNSKGHANNGTMDAKKFHKWVEQTHPGNPASEIVTLNIDNAMRMLVPSLKSWCALKGTTLNQLYISNGTEGTALGMELEKFRLSTMSFTEKTLGILSMAF